MSKDAGMANGLSDIEHAVPYGKAPKAPKDGKCTRCCCCVLIAVLAVIVAVLGVALLFILFIKPTKPHFSLESTHVGDFHVEKELHAFHSSAVYLSMNITLDFNASNPNRVGIKYSPSSFKCIYRDTLLGMGSAPSFYQPAHSTTIVQAVISVDRLNILQSMSAHLLKDATVSDNVPLNFTGPVEARIRFFGLESPKVQYSINCFIVLSPRSRDVKSKDCNVVQAGWGR